MPYPVTDELRVAVAQMLEGHAPLSDQLKKVVTTIIETVGEYEHGTADVEYVNEQEPVNIRQYSAVAFDLILTICNSME